MSVAEPLSRPRAIAWLGLLAAPYLLNDFGNIYVHAPVAWLACDYGSRVVSLATLAWLLRCGVIQWGDLRLRLGGFWRAVVSTLVGAAMGWYLDSGPGRVIFAMLPDSPLGSIPPITPAWLRECDYVAGLACVAVSEEAVFRGAFPRLIVRAGGAPWLAVSVSSLMFGLAHWSFGVGHILETALIGLLLAWCARFSRSLWPAIVAHYAIDLAAFG